MIPDKVKSLLITLLPFVIAVLIMIPRLVSAEFGLLDDGFILNEVRRILGGDPSMRLFMEAGRFRPFYWLYFTLIYVLVGPNPFWFFIGHLILLLVLLVEIRSLMKYLGANDWQILLTSLIFIFSIPIIENYYTLSKGEVVQLVFILAGLICLQKLKETNSARKTWLYAILTFISILSAIWAKETTYIMLPLAALWAAYVLYQRKQIPCKEQRAYLIFFGVVLASAAVNFLILSLLDTTLASGDSYASQYAFTLQAMISRAPRWITLYAFYFPYLLPLVVVVLMILFNKSINHSAARHDLFFFGVWILAWSTGFLPWEYAEAFYLLPFSVGISIMVGLLTPYIKSVIIQGNKIQRGVMASMVILFIVLFLASLTHYRTHALTQLAFDRINSQMLTKTKEILLEDGDLIMGVNTYNEYVQNSEHFLIDQDGMTRITFDFVSLEVLLGIQSRSDAIVVLPFINHQPMLLLRAGVEEEFTMAWVEEIEQTLDGQLGSVAHFRDGFQINNINLPVLACPILGSRGFCVNPDPFFDTRKFSYGWDIYQIQ